MAARWTDQVAIFDWDGPKTWDEPGADIIGDIAQAVKLFREATGRDPSSLHMSPKLQKILRDKEAGS